jgi:asparagine N-glycosylation enzyme membrane subunit Stt3
MQVVGMLIFLVVWLIVLWLGSIALETTGMERAKARFQALSALTGTGFTTREAESIVNHPKRRSITTWLIFIGNVGIIALIILMILYLRAGLTAPSVLHICIIIVSVLTLILLIKLRVMDKLTSGIVRLVCRGHAVSCLVTEELIYRIGEYGIANVVVSEKDRTAGFALKDIGFSKGGITVLAIERKDNVLPFPKAEEIVLAGDYLLCYGKVAEITSMTQ